MGANLTFFVISDDPSTKNRVQFSLRRSVPGIAPHAP